MPDLANVAYTNTAAARYTLTWLQLPRELAKVDYRSNTVIIITQPPAIVPPVVSNFVPSPGTAITAFTPLSFDVTDDGAFRRILVLASFSQLGLQEVVHDGDNFSAQYSARSSRSAITGGFHYSLLRQSGWVASPTITPYAYDTVGGENG